MGSVFIIGRTALTAWRQKRVLGGQPWTSSQAHCRNGIVPEDETVSHIRRICLLGEEPIHIGVGPTVWRSHRRNIVPHQCEPIMRKSSFFKVCSGIYVESPSAMFVRLANELDLIQLIELGFELCGTYCLSTHDSRGFAACDPLMDLNSLSRAIKAVKARKGAVKARSAVRFILSGSASPRETACAMMLTLPNKLGGCNIGGGVLNAKIPLDTASRSHLGKNYVKCDVLWPAERVAVEYDSRAWHSDPLAYERDSRRRNALGALRIDVVTLTNAEIMDAASFDRASRSLEKKLGRRHSIRCRSYPQARQHLRRMLLDPRERKFLAPIE